MSREILFRGMDDNKRLIQGYFFQIWEDCFILWGTTNGVPNMTKVDPATVGQFTGMCDRNQKKIFEGDIVRSDCNWDGVVAYFEELTWDGGCSHPGYYCKEWIDYDNELSYHHNFYNCEVIGNIHDTPDLETEEEAE